MGISGGCAVMVRVLSNQIPHYCSVQSSQKLSILWSLLPDCKEENKVDKSEDSSNSKDNEEGVLVVNRPEIMTSEKKF